VIKISKFFAALLQWFNKIIFRSIFEVNFLDIFQQILSKVINRYIRCRTRNRIRTMNAWRILEQSSARDAHFSRFSAWLSLPLFPLSHHPARGPFASRHSETYDAHRKSTNRYWFQTYSTYNTGDVKNYWKSMSLSVNVVYEQIMNT